MRFVCSVPRSIACPNATAFRSCSASSRGSPTPRQRGEPGGPSAQWRGGWHGRRTCSPGRLSRRGIGLAAVTLAIPGGSFVGSTARAATAFAGRTPVVPGIEPSVTRLAEGAMTMSTMTWKLIAASVALMLTASAGAWGFAGRGEPPPAAQPLVLVEGATATAQGRAKLPEAADPARTAAQRARERQQPEANLDRAAQLPRRERPLPRERDRQGWQGAPQLARPALALYRTAGALPTVQAR